MIEFNLRNEEFIREPDKYRKWVKDIVESEEKDMGDISYTFCNDERLDVLNQKYLNHTDYTDIISFDSTIGTIISGDIFISLERVEENAIKFDVELEEEILRVMAHGVLHFCGYKDGTTEESQIMREKENEKIKMFHVEQP